MPTLIQSNLQIQNENTIYFYTVFFKNSNKAPIPETCTDDSGIALRNIGIPTWRNRIGIPKMRRGDSGIIPIPKLRGTYTNKEV